MQTNPTKSFRLILDLDLFEAWRMAFPDRGVRQAFLRKVVRLMVHRHIIKNGKNPEVRPLWLKEDMINGPLDKVIEEMVDNLMEKS